MHCPRCGQQQMSDEIKFCSKCGFQLGLVAELVANDGFLPQLADIYNRKNSTIFTRRNGVAFSVLWTIFFLFLITPIWVILDAEELAAASAILGLFGGMMLLVSSMFFLRKSPSRVELTGTHMPASLGGSGGRQALPPQMAQPASTYAPPIGKWRAPDTDDLSRPGSVTESTTKLLKKEQND